MSSIYAVYRDKRQLNYELDPEKRHCVRSRRRRGRTRLVQWLLEGKDYRVRCYDSAETFLARYDQREVACLIVDIRMGGMTGLELQDKLVERKSPLPDRKSVV